MDVAPPQPVSQAGEITASPRERLIEAATRLFCRYGVNSVGVDEIVAAAGTAKTTLYRLFRSKDGLVEAVLDCEGRAWRAWFLAEIDAAGGPALARLHRIGPALRLWLRSPKATRPTTACVHWRSPTRRSCSNDLRHCAVKRD